MSNNTENLPSAKRSSDGSNSPEEEKVLYGASSSNAIQLQDQKHLQMKKAAAQMISKYFHLLKNGCGNSECSNPNCISSGKIGSISNNEAAVRALQLFTERAKLCDGSSISKLSHIGQDLSENEKVSKEQQDHTTIPGTVPAPDPDFEMESAPAYSESTVTSTTGNACKSLFNNFDSKNIGLNEEKLKNTIEECSESKNYAKLRILLRTIFSNETALQCSFLLSDTASNSQEKTKIKDKRKSIDSEIKCLDIKNDGASKEEIRSAESDLDKDIDCQEIGGIEDKEMIDVDVVESNTSKRVIKDDSSANHKGSLITVDVKSVRRAYQMLYKVPESEFSSTFMDAISQLLRDSLSIQLKVQANKFKENNSIVNIFVILLENPHLTSTEYTEEVLGDLCKVVPKLHISHQAALVRHISKWETTRVHRFLESLHQLITIRLLTTEFSRDFTINDEDTITSATCVMKLIYYASIISGDLDKPLLIDLPPPEAILPPIHQDHFMGAGKEGLGKAPPWDPLGKYLGIHPLDARKPTIPFEDFYDDFLSDQLEVDRDFAYFKQGTQEQFSFLTYPFILTPATKVLGLYYDNRVRMYSERRMSFFQTVMEGTPANPYLSLRIRRDHIIEDALVELELVSLENPGDLKKQLVVEFEGEQGIDEGGVSKEFFQLIVEQIFNPDYAMFCVSHDTETFWFNPTSFESDAQFTLVGVVLGLAIYNNVILDLHFPPVMYKKLCGKPGTFHDLKEWNTTLYSSLLDLLNYEGDDMEEVFMQTFRVGYQDIFGSSLHHDLRPDGNNVFVNQQNKEEFVTMYADFLLNKNVERQFSAFKRGFCMVTDDSPLQLLFRPYELELLVCGSQHYDFSELRKSTEYDGGYSASSPIINWFWELVDQIGAEEKKQLLQFTTGSARVPVGGLARLKLIIARNGPDTERLPTAHTCFNVLLLPEYSSKEKFSERLLKAIKYAQGFGML